ncbi:CHAT domain-containing tetratricopeptide repeat protein [Nonomuraea wenchangensis]|uniref:CHAT domain-containing protein n=1 Tax=Nonomuraea wenchangensis TaxID=568860 RepID=A0A1I0J7C1_9ACTN|nr:CHAT domain-containing tetratricopeptide repeat protein [Nonomuraea wenchangensis]SEU05082.1 CHAT domain-containing protein [Nonomuraea wenchangensis]
MTDPAETLAARIERFEQAADPELIWDPAALIEAEQAMRACAGDRSDAATWRLIGMLHLARYRLDPRTNQDAAVAGAFFAAVAVLDPARLPEKLRGASVPSADAAGTWAGLVEEVFRHVDPAAYPHVGLLVHALVRRAAAQLTADAADRLGELLLQQAMRSADPSWAPGALALLGGGLVRLHGRTGERELLDDAVHVLFRAALAAPGEATHLAELAAALALAVPDDEDLVRAYLSAAESEPGSRERSRALLSLVGLAQARAARSCLDDDLLAFIRVGQCALDFWHERWAHPGVLGPYAAGLVEWYVVTGDERSLEAGHEMLQALGLPTLAADFPSDTTIWDSPAPLDGSARSDSPASLDGLARSDGPASLGDPARSGGLARSDGPARSDDPDATGGPYAPGGPPALDADPGGDLPPIPATPLTADRVAYRATFELARRLSVDPLARLALLGERRRRRYEATGAQQDLDVAVETLREATREVPPGHPDRPRLLADLAATLLERTLTTGGDPAAPVAAARTALAAHAVDDPARPAALLLLARALRLRLTPSTAAEAVAALREALATGDRLTPRLEAYTLLSELLRWRATHQDAAPHRAEDLDGAVLTARQAAELAVKSSRDQIPAHRLLSRALLARFSHGGDPRDLGEALALARDGDPDLLAQLDVLLTDPTRLPVDEHLARAAADLALQTSDEPLTLKLLAYAERHPTASTSGPRGELGRGAFLLETGLRLADAGRRRTAGTVLARAAAAFDDEGDRALTAHALSLQGVNHDHLNDPARAAEAFERAAAVHRTLGDLPAEAEQLGHLGDVLLRAGDPAGAVEQHLRAIALCAGAGLGAREAVHQMRAAEAYLAAADPAAALACAARAREVYLALGEPREAALVLVPAARAAVDQGDLTAAGERIAACAIELEAAGAWEDACRALDAHAVLLSVRGHHAPAAACEARLVEVVRRRGGRREPADEWYRIAQRRRATGDPAGARAAFELAEAEYQAIGHLDGSAAVRYNLGALAYGQGEAGRALEEFGAAAEAFARLRAHGKEATALTMRAAALSALDLSEDAATELDRALDLAAAGGDLDALFLATLHRAVLDERLGEFLAAGERLRAALGQAAADPLKEAVVRDRLASLAARLGDLPAQIDALEQAVTGFRAAAQPRLAALTSLRLGFALEERGEHRRARTALESGLTTLTPSPQPPTGSPSTGSPSTGSSSTGSPSTGSPSTGGLPSTGSPPREPGSQPPASSPSGQEGRWAGAAPFEIVVAMAASGGLDADVLARVASVQLALGDLTRGRATLAEAVTTLRAGRDRVQAIGPAAAERLETWLRLEEAESAGDLPLARAMAEQALAQARPEARPGAPVGDPRHEGGIGHPPGRGDDAPGAGAAPLLPQDRSHLLAKLSSYCLALGDLTAAYSYAAEGYELRDARTIEHLRHLGAAAHALGRPDEAIGHLTRAVELARDDAGPALPSPLVHALTALARALADQARWTDAARAYDEGLTLTTAPVWRALRAPLLSGRASLHLERGELDVAASLYRDAIVLREELAERAGLGGDYADLAFVHVLRGETAQAGPLLERALAVHRETGDDRGTVLSLIALSTLASAPASAHLADHLEEAADLARRIGFGGGEGLALAALGALDLADGDPGRAWERLSRAVELLEDLGHDPALGLALEHRTDAATRLGDLAAALTDAEHACDLATLTPATPHPTPLAGSVPSGRDGQGGVLDRAVSLAVRLGRGRTAWARAEQAKVRSLAARLGDGRWPAPPGVPPELLEREERDLDRARTLTAAAGRVRDPVRAAALVRRAHAVRDELETLWRHLEPLAPWHVAARRAAPLTGAELDKLVARDEPVGLLGFHVGEGGVTVLAHRTGWAEPRAFGCAANAALLAEFVAGIDGERPGLLDLAARRRRLDLWRRLADLLLADALRELGDDLSMLHLLPHRELHRVPLHALAPDGGPPLIERCPVTYAPSAAVLARLARDIPVRADGRSLVMAHGTDPDAGTAALLGAEPRTGGAATSAHLAGSWDVVDLSADVVHDPRDPLGVGVRLADGVLTARRLMSLRVRARLVVLTGCAGGPRAGDGLATLGQAFLHAGAHTVLLALWPPAGEITRALLRDLHGRTREGADPAQALREGVLSLRELYGAAEPELWAPYALLGLPR